VTIFVAENCLNHTVFNPQSSEDDLWQEWHERAGRWLGNVKCYYGFTHLIATTLRKGMSASLVSKCSYDESYLQLFPNDSVLDDEITAIRLSEDGNIQDTLWSDVESIPNLSESHLERSRLDDDLGFSVGVSFGLRFGYGVAGIGIQSDLSAEQFRAQWKNHSLDVKMLFSKFDAAIRPIMVANRFKLSPREREILNFSAAGMTAKELAHHLKLSPKSVENIAERARKALNATNTAEAIARAIIFGLL
jgi:DNA-binding CsgD family transcriptional regulator